MELQEDDSPFAGDDESQYTKKERDEIIESWRRSGTVCALQGLIGKAEYLAHLAGDSPTMRSADALEVAMHIYDFVKSIVHHNEFSVADLREIYTPNVNTKAVG